MSGGGEERRRVPASNARSAPKTAESDPSANVPSSSALYHLSRVRRRAGHPRRPSHRRGRGKTMYLVAFWCVTPNYSKMATFRALCCGLDPSRLSLMSVLYSEICRWRVVINIGSPSCVFSTCPPICLRWSARRSLSQSIVALLHMRSSSLKPRINTSCSSLQSYALRNCRISVLVQTLAGDNRATCCEDD